MRLRNHARRRTTGGAAVTIRRREGVGCDATATRFSARTDQQQSRDDDEGERTHVLNLEETHADNGELTAPVRTRLMRKCSASREKPLEDRRISDQRLRLEPLLPYSEDKDVQVISPIKRQPQRERQRVVGERTPLADGLKQASAKYFCLLQTAFAHEDRIGETNWLTSTLIDLMLWRLATQYADVHFLATDFCHLYLPSVARRNAGATATTPAELYDIRDVLGHRVDYASSQSIVFVANVGRIHWNLLRVQFVPHAELQLFEPMGRLSSRSGISYRSVPRCVIEWLDSCYPQYKSWITRSVSAITKPQQVSGFDCGVACLLYADKCGQGQPREAINDSTDQHEITTFRSELQRQLQSELLPPPAA